ncbi:hypothetical protein CsSME_00040168 [Camellia sinensis var. sinensis]
MASSSRRRKRRTRKPRRTQYKKRLNRSKNKEIIIDVDDGVGVTSSGCSTPKGPRFQIPPILTCPPAPKKQRVASNCSLLRRTPIAFFAPPDLELFFSFALRDIMV